MIRPTGGMMSNNFRLNAIALGVIAVGATSSASDARAERPETGQGTYCEFVADFLFCPPNGMALICGAMGYPDDFGICLPSFIEPGVYSWYCCRYTS